MTALGLDGSAALAQLDSPLPHWAMERNLVLQAGAGTGKTHALVTLALHLLSGANARRTPVEAARFVAVTFTEKAGTELRERIQRRIAPLADGKSLDECEPELARTRSLLGLAAPRAEFWQRLRRDLALAHIGTFHGFCAALLRRASHALGLDPAFGLLDEEESRELFAKSTEDHLLEKLGEGDAGARALVEEYQLTGSDRAPGLVDLSRAVLSRVIEEGLSAATLDDGRFDQVRAAQAVRDAQEALAGAASGLSSLPASARAKLGDAPRVFANVAAEPLDEAALERLADARRSFRKPSRGAAAEAVEKLDEVIEQARTAVAGLRTAPLGRAFVSLLDGIEKRYRAAKDARNALDFGDLQRLARDLLRSDRAARREAKARVGALLVDEFQDTSRLQLDLVALLAESRSAEAVLDGMDIPRTVRWEPGLLCIVGDRKQSIYEFRGADVAVVQVLQEAVTGPAAGGLPARIEHLQRSWRSRPALVTFANDLFRRAMPSASRPFEVAFGPHDALEPASTETPEGPLAEIVEARGADAAEQRADEAARLAARLDELLHDRGAPVRVRDGDRLRPVEGRDIAILLRGLTHVALYTQALAARGIAHVVVGGGGLYEAQEVLDGWALLRAIDEPDDAVASVALLRSPWCSLSDPTLTRLALGEGPVIRGVTLDALLRHPPVLDDAAESERLAALLRFVDSARRELDRMGPACLLRLALEELDYLAVVARLPGADAVAANVARLESVLRAEEARGATARAAVRTLTRRVRTPPRAPEAPASEESDPRCVRIMSVHQSKGLEFPVTVVADCGAHEPSQTARIAFDRDHGLALGVRLPDGDIAPGPGLREVRATLAARAAAESLRLFYVAATRARDYLVLSGAPAKRSWFEAASALDASQLRRVDVDPSQQPEPLSQHETAAESPERTPSTHMVAAEPPASAVPIRALTATVTQLVDLDLCAERYRLRHLIGLHEHPAAEVALEDETEEWPLDIFERGTLAHRLLEVADFDPDAPLDDLLRAEGVDPEGPEVSAIRDDVRAFLHSPFAREVARAPRRLRELPFFLTLDLPGGRTDSDVRHLRLKGQIDLVSLDASGIRVIDYKHTRARGRDAAHWRFQLACYALAVQRTLGTSLPVEVGIVFLQDRSAPPALLRMTAEEIAAHEQALRRLGESLFDSRCRDEWPRRESAHCTAIGCGYRARCHGKVGGEAPRAAPEASAGEVVPTPAPAANSPCASPALDSGPASTAAPPRQLSLDLGGPTPQPTDGSAPVKRGRTPAPRRPPRT